VRVTTLTVTTSLREAILEELLRLINGLINNLTIIEDTRKAFTTLRIRAIIETSIKAIINSRLRTILDVIKGNLTLEAVLTTATEVFATEGPLRELNIDF
jgi:hypothetical protein